MLKRYVVAMLAAAIVTSTAASAQEDSGRSAVNARTSAIHACSVKSGRYPESTFSSLEFELYRACMAEQGQTE